MPADGDRRTHRMTKWGTPLFAVGAGAAFWIAAALGGHPALGGAMFGVMLVFASIFLIGGRSETIRAMRGDGRDERFGAIDLRATAVSGLAMATFCIIGSLVAFARGSESGGPYPAVCAIGGLAYLAAYLVLRVRS